MRSEETFKLLTELLDGHCDAARKELLRQQVEKCPECFRALGIEQEVRALLRRCCSAQAPEALRIKIVMQLSLRGARQDMPPQQG
ncbi:MAG: mycothiol system anti-sigma-R factor [Corynebacterium sp.]|nr:mycothiol system anti-sigma-R factor [Corynebacterium sp.]